MAATALVPVGGDGRTAKQYTATSAPTADNDSAHGSTPCDIVVNTTSGHAYICVDASVGAASWKQID